MDGLFLRARDQVGPEHSQTCRGHPPSRRQAWTSKRSTATTLSLPTRVSGGERHEVQQNFPTRTGTTANLFLQHFNRKLRAGGHAAVAIKDTFLSNTDNTSVALRKVLLESCNLHTILDCPQGTFQGAGVKTVVLFFEKGAPTRQAWYYQLDPGRSLGKMNALNADDPAEFIELQMGFAEGSKSWTVQRGEIDDETFDLSVKNPNAPEAEALRSPEEIIADMLARDAETAAILEDIWGDG